MRELGQETSFHARGVGKEGTMHDYTRYRPCKRIAGEHCVTSRKTAAKESRGAFNWKIWI